MRSRRGTLRPNRRQDGRGPPAAEDPRRQLLALHRDARRRRDAAPLGSQEYRAAAMSSRRIEVRDRPDRAGPTRPRRAQRGTCPRPRRAGSDRPRPDLRGRAARRAPERGDADPDRGEAALHRAARRRRPARDRGDVLRRARGDPPARRRRRAPADAPAPATGVRYPGPRPERARPRPGRGRRRRCARRLHGGDRRVHRAQHRHDGRRIRSPPSRPSSPEPASWAGGGAATSRPPSAARTPARVEPARAVDVALRLRRARGRRDLLRRHDRRRRSRPRSRELVDARRRRPASRSTGSRSTSTTPAGPPSPTSPPG